MLLAKLSCLLRNRHTVIGTHGSFLGYRHGHGRPNKVCFAYVTMSKRRPIRSDNLAKCTFDTWVIKQLHTLLLYPWTFSCSRWCKNGYQWLPFFASGGPQITKLRAKYVIVKCSDWGILRPYTTCGLQRGSFYVVYWFKNVEKFGKFWPPSLRAVRLNCTTSLK